MSSCTGGHTAASNDHDTGRAVRTLSTSMRRQMMLYNDRNGRQRLSHTHMRMLNLEIVLEHATSMQAEAHA